MIEQIWIATIFKALATILMFRALFAPCYEAERNYLLWAILSVLFSLD